MTLREIQNEVIKKYRIKINTDSDCWSRMHAHIKTRTVCKWKPKNSLQATFDLFHEIGHIVTNHSGMRRCEQEYYATKWAAERFREYGLTVPKKTAEVYQKYIDEERSRGIRRHGIGLPSMDALRIEW